MILNNFRHFCATKESYSQINQDLLALFCFGKKPGYFVEFGACDGVYLSNTFLLETYYGWQGLLVEPSKHYNKILPSKRTAKIDTLCVSDKSGDQIEFVEVENFEGLSGIAEYAYNDVHTETRKHNGNNYMVDTISLKDLLEKHSCPETVDYLSIDTEGSEYHILNSYDFSTKFNLITVEHNNTYTKELIADLLTSKGYVMIMPEESKWDSWFVSKDLYDRISQ